MLYEKFGEFNSAEEINELAMNLREEKDIESIRILAEENGIPKDYAEIMIKGEWPYLCDPTTAAIGKIDVEVADLNPKGIMSDWADYIKAVCMEDGTMAENVRKKGKSLKGCIGKLLKYSFENAETVDSDIVRAAGIKASKVTFGMPGQKEARKLIKAYYGGK